MELQMLNVLQIQFPLVNIALVFVVGCLVVGTLEVDLLIEDHQG